MRSKKFSEYIRSKPAFRKVDRSNAISENDTD